VALPESVPDVAADTKIATDVLEPAPEVPAGPGPYESMNGREFSDEVGAPGPVADRPAPTDESRRAALNVLDKALRLMALGDAELPAIEVLRGRARSLRESVLAADGDGLSEEAVLLASGDHPLARLLAAVERPEALGDVEWADLHVVIAESFGRPVAVAMARQRLVLDAGHG
jgi:hypothetical protein